MDPQSQRQTQSPKQGFYHRSEGKVTSTSWTEVDTTISNGSTNETGKLWVPPGSYDPVYDDEGNLTNDGKWDYTWDGRNRLLKMKTTTSLATLTGKTTTIDYVYDWRGRRIGKTVKQKIGTNTETTEADRRFVYEGWNLIAELDNTQSTAADKFFREYLWGLDLSGTPQGAGGVGGLLAVRKISSAEITYPSYDGNGNIIAWTKSQEGTTASAILQMRDYDPFGNLISKEDRAAIPGGDMPFGFSTKYQDEETGLLYYGYRYYDPVTGRWPSRDPIGERGGVNLYGMVGNDAISGVDVLGLTDFDGTASEGIFDPVGGLVLPPNPTDQWTGYQPGNRWDWFEKRYPHFIAKTLRLMFRKIKWELQKKCDEMPGKGEWKEGPYYTYFKSKKNHELREDEFGEHPQPKPTEHPEDEPQNRYEAQFQIGSFTLNTRDVKYGGWVSDSTCKCGISWDGVLAIYDVPGLTVGKYDDSKFWNILPVVRGGNKQEIGSKKVGGFVCCRRE